MKKLIFILFTFLLLVGCSKESQKLPITTSAEKEYTVYADATTAKKDGIKFTATQPWKATVQEVTSKAEDNGRVDWVTLNAYEGPAGEFTLIITLNQNFTGNDRKAEIIIECGDTIITFTVEQKGTKQDGSKPEDDNPLDKLVTKIESTFFFHGEIEGKESLNFYYDKKGYIVKMVDTLHEEDVDVTTLILSYSDNSITIENSEPRGGIRKGSMVLDAKGRITSGNWLIDKDGEVSGQYNFNINFNYNSDGYLTEVTGEDANEKRGINEKLTWKDGNLVELWNKYGGGVEANYGGGVQDNYGRYVPSTYKVTYGNLLNKANIDLNWYILSSSNTDIAFFALLGNIGKRAKNMATQGGCSRFEYEVDKDGYITLITEYSEIADDDWEKTVIYKITYNK